MFYLTLSYKKVQTRVQIVVLYVLSGILVARTGYWEWVKAIKGWLILRITGMDILLLFIIKWLYFSPVVN